MKNSLLVVLFSLATIQAFSQIRPDQANEFEENVRNGIEYLSSEECQGRATADVGMEMAKAYIIENLRESRMLPAFERERTGNFLQRVPLIQSEIYGGELLFGREEFKYPEDFYYFRNLENRPFTADAVSFVGYGLHDEKYSEYEESNFNGRAVIMLGADIPKKLAKVYPKKERKKKTAFNYRLEMLKRMKPAFIVVVDPKFDSNKERFSRYLSSPLLSLNPMYLGMNEDDMAPGEGLANEPAVVYISDNKGHALINSIFNLEIQKGDLLRRLSAKNKLSSVPGRFDPRIAKAEVDCHNVGAYIPGENDDNVIILSAHLDHLGIDHENGEIYFGADDNASGSASLLAIAKMMQADIVNGHPIPQNPIMFLWFTGEEKGLLGSKFYTNNPAFPLDNTLVNLNVDMVGRSDKHHGINEKYIYLIGADRNSEKLTGLIQATAMRLEIELDFKFNDPEDPNQFYKRSDHYNFAKSGVPVAFFFSGVHEDYHKPSDTFDKINFEVLQRRAELILTSTMLLADYTGELRSESSRRVQEELRMAEELKNQRKNPKFEQKEEEHRKAQEIKIAELQKAQEIQKAKKRKKEKMLKSYEKIKQR